MIIYGRLRSKVSKILSELCERKVIKTIEEKLCPDQIHMLISIPSKLSVSSLMGYLKGKSSLMIFERFTNLNYRYGSRKFLYRGYYVDTIGRNQKKIQAYIRNPLADDKHAAQLALNELVGPFTGESMKKD